MSGFEELRELEEQGIDLIEIVGQDRPLGSPGELQELVSRLARCGDDLCARLLHFLTLRRFGSEEARGLWQAIAGHRQEMTRALGRTVSFRVAALDYLADERGLLRGVRLVPRAELEGLLSYVNVDEVTAVFNRRYFHDALGREFLRARRYDFPLSLMILDVDDFKAINDEHGHLEGDLVLRRVGRLLQESSRDADSVCRYGGDEFVILLPQTDTEAARVAAERLLGASRTVEIGDDSDDSEALWAAAFTPPADPVELPRAEAHRTRHAMDAGDRSEGTALRQGAGGTGAGAARVTFSIGVATYPSHCDEIEELIALADQMCLEAKRAGKNRVRVSDAAGGDWALGA